MGIPFTDLPECDRIQAWKTPHILSPGVDYPQTFQELDNWFRNDAACREYPPTQDRYLTRTRSVKRIPIYYHI